MKRWIGSWLIGVSALHTVYAAAVHGNVLASIVQRGVFNTVGGDPKTGAVVWFVLFGGLLFVCGLAIAHLEKASSKPVPRSIGWCLLAIAMVGVTLMPASGFWLVFPPAIAVLLMKANPKLVISES